MPDEQAIQERNALGLASPDEDRANQASSSMPRRTPELEEILRSLERLDIQQQCWLLGYIEGKLAASGMPAPGLATEATEQAGASQPLTILYGSQTGNAEAVAQDLGKRWQSGLGRVNVHSLGRYRLNRLRQESRVLIIISTHGEGDPPDSALAFCNALSSEGAPQFPDLGFAVVGLGDSSYKHFCKPARDIDERLAQLGAGRLAPRLECDLDYAGAIAQWEGGFLDEISQEDGAKGRATILSLTPKRAEGASPSTAEVIERVNLCLDEADKRVWHIELESEAAYQCGDAVAIQLRNPAELCELVRARIEPAQAQARFSFAGKEGLSLEDILSQHAELYRLSYTQLRQFIELFPNSALGADPSDEAKMDRFVEEGNFADLLASADAPIEADKAIALLRPMTDRLYSIASSPSAHPGEIHVTVRERGYGLASPQLAQLAVGKSVEIYIKPNPSFRLPEDPGGDIIMIGAGTGVAPYRSFLEQRLEMAKAGERIGRSWLIMGEQSFHTSFLYQADWQRYLKEGSLKRISLAFSRDQARKIYVHHRIAENAEQIHRWLSEGASLYVCGDAKRMAGDVHQALAEVYTACEGLDEAGAKERLALLAAEGRYQRDVY